MMDTEDGCESWDWPDDDFNVNDNSQPGIAYSVWQDSILQEELNERPFSDLTPETEARDVEIIISSMERKGNNSPDHFSNFAFQQDSSVLKRRRMLLFPDVNINSGKREGGVEDVDQSSKVEHPHSMVSRSSCLNKTDNLHNQLDESLDFESFNNWLTQCFVLDGLEDSLLKSADLVTGTNQIVSEKQRSSEIVRLESSSEIVNDGNAKPGFPRSSRPSSELVYPFRLVKPCSVEGDLTLQDINRKIHEIAPDAFLQRESQHAQLEQIIPAPVGSKRKAIASLTRIRTEGKGTITIIRTRDKTSLE